HSPPNEPTGDFLYITAKNIKANGVSLRDVTYVDKKVHDEIYARCNPERGDILYVKDGATTGVAAINDLPEPFSMLSSVALLKLPDCIFNALLLHFLRSPFFYQQMRGFMKGGAIPRVTLKRMAPALLPLPPLAEQHRIVAKVDELMALCDQLEAARQQREQTRERLVAASLQRLNQPSEDPASFRQHAQFALQTLPSLTPTPAQVKQLRQTILNLAVRGKLVEQDPEDEPAEGLSKIFKAEKTWLAKTGQIRKPKQLSEVNHDDFPMVQGWLWERLGCLSTVITKGSTPTSYGHAYTEAGVSFVKVESIKDGALRPSGINSFISPGTNEFLSRSRLEAGDILFSIAGSIGTCAIVEESILPANTNQALAIIRGTQMVFNPGFLLAVLRSSLAQSVLLKA
ncbi:MAG: restriction endonuclease subunit S, partial [Cyanobium sp.]